MGLLDELRSEESWQAFYQYKISHHCTRAFAEELTAFIDGKGYLPVLESIAAGKEFPLPRKTILNKLRSGKKRVVYTYPAAENMVLKLLTFLMIRRYDCLFDDNLYSFRPNHGAKEALRYLSESPEIGEMFAYKVDISNYFNSIDLSLLLPMLRDVLREDPELYVFLAGLLTETRVLAPVDHTDCGTEQAILVEEKGIMAGTPLACFYANLFLRELDHSFATREILYARYSDDIILFAGTAEERARLTGEVSDFLAARHLSVNPEKEVCSDPHEKWVFLGCSYLDGTVDIAPASAAKLKHKMRRKTRALKRWQEKKQLTPQHAAVAFIRAFHRKLFENPNAQDLTWTRWYYPVINTPQTLSEIDHYAQDCLRYLLSGKRTKGRFQVRYEDLKALGYRSLVNAYYEQGNGTI